MLFNSAFICKFCQSFHYLFQRLFQLQFIRLFQIETDNHSVLNWLFFLQTASLLREYNNNELLEREFGGSPLIAVEISNYLKQPTNKDWHYLDRFPTIKRLYLKYNCISCNEADVERIFSFAGIPSFVTVKVKGFLSMNQLFFLVLCCMVLVVAKS